MTDSPMAIGEILLGTLFQVLLDKLASLGLDYVQREGINTAMVQKWRWMLETISALLEDAENKLLNGDRPVKLWMDDVRDWAYDMEDLLDELEIEATQAKSEAESSTSGGQLKRKFSFFSRPRPFMSGSKAQEINGRFEEIVTRKALLNLRENGVDKSHYTNKRLPSTCLPEPRFFGREKEEAQVLELLISNVQNFDATPSIVPIIGMGGVGKTALAQRLYNDDKVSIFFERRAWVCVSDVFDVLNITKTILRSITGLSCEDTDLNELQVKLKDSLYGKKFLVVLDDIWNEKYGEWTSLLRPFEAGAKGSKIIITTRNLAVVSITGALPYTLKQLSIDNCTSLLAYHAVGVENFARHPNLETVGKKIAEKCGGLPLTAKILGGLLRSKEDPEEWEAILNNKIWDLAMRENDEVLLALKLSYLHLPSYLKRCFLYCAIFPKDYEFQRDELTLLWIAECFVDGGEGKENILMLARNYFDELVSKSFFQQSNVDTSKFFMHDLLNDLAKSIADVTCFSSEGSQLAANEDDASFEKVRYASFSSRDFVTSKCVRAYRRMKVLRSLMLLHVGSFRHLRIYISDKVLHDLLTELKYLRVFSLCHYCIVEVPNCVSDLKHLRYLNFSYTDIKRLPESIVALSKLQALILRGCQKLTMLPLGITKMVNLKFLDIRDTESLEEIPSGIGNLKNLTILSKFIVGPEKRSRLKELKNLPHLQGELFVSNLRKVEEFRDAAEADLSGKRGLRKLILLWGKDCEDVQSDEHEAQVLLYLRPHTNLENLTISYYSGVKFPSWLDNPSYLKIMFLCFRGCPNVNILPPLGQLPSLRELSLEGLNAVSMIGSEFYGTKCPFPSLSTLKFEQMEAWKDWSHYVGGQEKEVLFSCLQHLVVQNCPALIGTLPCRLDNLMKLEIRSCPHLNNSSKMVSLPSLHELYIEDCDKEILKNFVNITSLCILDIANIAELVCFDPAFMSCLVKLKELYVAGCNELSYLWQDGNDTQNLTCLQRLAIRGCPRFISFAAGEGEMELPCNLERMDLSGCTNLEQLPSKIHNLRSLRVWNCPKIMGLNIPQYDLCSNNPMYRLESLEIRKCDSPTPFSFAKGRLAALKTVGIWKCNGVESLEEIIVEQLEEMKINRCESLGSLPQSLHTLSHLTRLEIWNCPALKIEEFPPLPITLLSFYLYNCPKVRSLPKQWHHLISLQNLFIWNCPNIKCFPEGGFPPNLQILFIVGCDNLEQPLRKWGLPFLTSLEQLKIDGRSIGGGDGEKVCFPSEENLNLNAWSLLFPPALNGLAIADMRKVERLSSGLRDHLSSLTYLRIEDCPKLRYFPEDGLPPSLQHLHIDKCENLKDRCSKLTGDYWPLIQDIPLLRIDWVRIQ